MFLGRAQPRVENPWLDACGHDVDGEVAIPLSNPLRLGEGVYTLVVREIRECVTWTGDKGQLTDVSMDVSHLGSLYLGGARARVLARGGRIIGRPDEALDRLDALMAHREPTFCITSV